MLTPERLRAPSAVDEVLGLDPVLLVLADYGQIVPAPLLDLPLGALNLHPSLLPRHRGASPIPATILAGDRETGVTLMRMDAGLDTGPIVAQRRLAAHRDGDGAQTSRRSLATMAADLLADNLRPWMRGDATARPQPAEGATLTAAASRGRPPRPDPSGERARTSGPRLPAVARFLRGDADRSHRRVGGHVLPGEPGDRPGTFVPDDADGARPARPSTGVWRSTRSSRRAAGA